MELASMFSGNVTMTTTNPNAPGPFVQDLSLGVRFTDCRSVAQIVSFPAITVGPFDTPVGSNTTTVTLAEGGSGVFDPASGRLDIRVTLHFSHSIGPPLAGPSDVTLDLSTSGRGGEAIRMGRGALTGTGRFRGGFLDGSTCNVTVRGILSPSP